MKDIQSIYNYKVMSDSKEQYIFSILSSLIFFSLRLDKYPLLFMF